MAAGSTYTPIATTTLGSSQQYITFSSISGSYTDLVLIMRTTGASTNINWDVEVGNGTPDTGNNYSITYLLGNGTSASSTRLSNNNTMRLGNAVYTQTSGGNFMGIANFMNYANTTTFKSVISRQGNPNLGTEASVALWRNTSAINVIRIGNGGGATMASGTTATLYGIAAA
jgi:hypothetical protein